MAMPAWAAGAGAGGSSLLATALARAGDPVALGALLRDALEFTARAQLAAALVVVTGVLVSSARRLAPGWQRFAATVPVLAANTFLPLLFKTTETELVARLVLVLLSSCANMKVRLVEPV
jgi:hypothetical protein